MITILSPASLAYSNPFSMEAIATSDPRISVSDCPIENRDCAVLSRKAAFLDVSTARFHRFSASATSLTFFSGSE